MDLASVCFSLPIAIYKTGKNPEISLYTASFISYGIICLLTQFRTEKEETLKNSQTKAAPIRSIKLER